MPYHFTPETKQNITYAMDRLAKILGPAFYIESSKRGQVALVLIISLSFVATLATSSIYTSWYITSSRFIDPWIYWGTGEDLTYPIAHFSGTYYFRRWTLIFPNYIFQHIFDPYSAQLLLRSLLLFGILSSASILCFRLTNSVLAACASIILIIGSEYIIRSIGISYNQGTGLMLFLITLNLILTGTRFVTPLRWLTIGSLGGLLIITYPWTVYLFPAMMAFATACYYERNNELIAKEHFPRILCALSFALIGFASLILLDWYIGKLLGTPWENLITYSLKAGIELARSGNWGVDFVTFWTKNVLSAFSFPMVGILLLLASAALFRHSIGHHHSRALKPLVIALIFVYLLDPFIDNNALVVPQTNVYMAIVCCLFAACLASDVMDGRDADLRRALRLIFITATPLLFGKVFESFLMDYWVMPAGLTLFLSATLFIKSQTSLRHGFSRRFMPLALIFTLITALSIPLMYFGKRPDHGYSSNEEARNFITTLSNEHRALSQIGGAARLWILDLRPNPGWSANISSLYGLYSALTIGYPPVPASCDQVKWILGMKNSVIVVYGATSFQVAANTVDSLVNQCGIFSYSPSSVKIPSTITLEMHRN